MATGGIGALTVSLGLDAAQFTNGLTKAQQQAKQFADATAAIAAGTAFGQAIYDAAKQAAIGLKDMVFGSIDAADHLNDLSKKTGIAVETLGGIGFAAGQAGGDLESASAAAGKLNKSLAEAAAGNKEASEAFKVLGIDVKDATGKTKTADAVMVEIADKFAGFADGPEKAALALKIFGKAGADMIPLLNDGGAALQANIAYFKRYSGVTKEVAEQSDAFNDTLGKVKLISHSFGTTLAADLLPLLQTVADRFLAAKEQGDGFKGAADGITAVLQGLVIAGAYVADTFRGIGREIGALAAQGDVLSEAFSDASLLEKTSPALMLARLSKAFQSARFTGISEAVKEDGERAKQELADLVNAVRHPFDASGFSKTASSFGGGAANKPDAPRLSGEGGEKAAKEAAKKLKEALDGQIKIIQDFGKAQAEAYKFGETYLDGVYADGLISQREFFATQKQVRDAALQAQLDTIDKEIAAERKFANDPVAKGSDRQAAIEKIKLAEQQRLDVVTKASAADILAAQSEARAVDQLADAYVSLAAQVLANSGDTFGADALRNAQEVAKAAELINKQNGDRSVVDTLASQLDLRRQAAQQQKEYAKLLDDTARREAEIYVDAEVNGKTELQTLAAIRDARQIAIVQLKQQAEAAAALAAQSGNEADIKRAQDLALAFKKAGAEIDPLAKKFDAVFEDSFANAFSGFLSGTKSAKDAFRDFASSVIQGIANIAAKNLAQAIFSGASSSSWGSLFSLLGLGSTGGATTQGGATQGMDFSGTGFPLASGTNFVPYDNFKATLHRGEEVTPAKYNPAAGGSRGGQGDVYISNNAPAQVHASRDDNGDLQVVIEEAARRGATLAASQVASGRGPMAQALRGRGITLDRSNARKG